MAATTQSAIGSACSPLALVSAAPVASSSGVSVARTPAAALWAHLSVPCAARATAGGTP